MIGRRNGGKFDSIHLNEIKALSSRGEQKQRTNWSAETKKLSRCLLKEAQTKVSNERRMISSGLQLL
jgi:hypothetical protein